MDSLAVIRQQVRSVVDPMFLRLMNRLYDHPNASQLRDSVIPTTTVVRIVQQYLQSETAFSDLSFVLGEPMNLGSCVRLGTDQKIYLALSANASHAGTCIGLLKAIDGTQGIVCSFGRLSLPSVWTSLTPNQFVYVSPTGGIQQTLPTIGFIQRIGIAINASSVLVYPFDTPFLLS